jgi:hypothetical protein
MRTPPGSNPTGCYRADLTSNRKAIVDNPGHSPNHLLSAPRSDATAYSAQEVDPW